RRLMERTPVDDPVRAVDPPFAIEMHEEAHDCAHVRVVHRETLATVVERGTHSAKLEHDLAAVLAQPFPDELLEGFTSEVLPRLALLGQLLLDRVLRGAAGATVRRMEDRRVTRPYSGA